MISMYPVAAKVTPVSFLVTPVVYKGKIVDFYGMEGMYLPLSAGFAINVHLLREFPTIKFESQVGRPYSLACLFGLNFRKYEIEAKADNCTKVILSKDLF